MSGKSDSEADPAVRLKEVTVRLQDISRSAVFRSTPPRRPRGRPRKSLPATTSTPSIAKFFQTISSVERQSGPRSRLNLSVDSSNNKVKCNNTICPVHGAAGSNIVWNCLDLALVENLLPN